MLWCRFISPSVIASVWAYTPGGSTECRYYTYFQWGLFIFYLSHPLPGPGHIIIMTSKIHPIVAPPWGVIQGHVDINMPYVSADLCGARILCRLLGSKYGKASHRITQCLELWCNDAIVLLTVCVCVGGGGGCIYMWPGKVKGCSGVKFLK